MHLKDSLHHDEHMTTDSRHRTWNPGFARLRAFPSRIGYINWNPVSKLLRSSTLKPSRHHSSHNILNHLPHYEVVYLDLAYALRGSKYGVCYGMLIHIRYLLLLMLISSQAVDIRSDIPEGYTIVPMTWVGPIEEGGKNHTFKGTAEVIQQLNMYFMTT